MTNTPLRPSYDISKSKFKPVDCPGVLFDDIAGLDYAKQCIVDNIVLPILRPDLFENLGIENGDGILLYGPPGTGKTMFAQAVATEINAAFFEVKVSDIESSRPGESERNISELFHTARAFNPAIIFFDEFESLGMSRDIGSNQDIYGRNVTELLAQIQGFTKKPTMLILIAATNRPWDIDAALLRPGRFGTQIFVGLPNFEARLAIIQKQLATVSFENNYNLSELAEITDGYNGADLAELCKRIKMNSIRRNVTNQTAAITENDIDNALKVMRPSVNTEMIRRFEWYNSTHNDKDATLLNDAEYPITYKEILKSFREKISKTESKPVISENTIDESEYRPEFHSEIYDVYLEGAKEGDPEDQYNLALVLHDGIEVTPSDAESAKWMIKAAEQGHIRAQFNLAVMYEQGIGLPQSDSISAKWFKSAAEKGDEEAQFTIGMRYFHGKGVPQSYEEAFQWNLKAANKQFVKAEFNVAHMYHMGIGTNQSYSEAIKWYKIAASHGDVGAKYNLGLLYDLGEGVPKSYEEAAKWYKLAAEDNFTKAQVRLAEMYAEGLGVPKSINETYRYNRMAAENGDAEAQLELGLQYINGDCIEQSATEAVKWFKKSAEQGNSKAMYNLGLLASQGRGMPASYSEALKWYKMSSDRGFSWATNDIGYMYETGMGVPQSYEMALEWYLKAVEQGDSKAILNVAIMYHNGRGTPASPEKCVHYLTIGAERGIPKAQYLLGLNYICGDGVAKSFETGIKWIRLAAQKGYKDAIEDLQKYNLW